VRVEDGAAVDVTLANVPAYSVALDRKITLPTGETVTYDLAYGGNFYAILPLEQLGLPFDRAYQGRDPGRRAPADGGDQRAGRAGAPAGSDVPGCHHVQFLAPDATPQHSRHAMAIHPGWFDRSPCGTGTSARMAQLHARGQLEVGQEFVNESFIGTRFTGRLLGETTVGGLPAVLPSITGRAWITATAQYLLDPTDPFPAGFLL
jgi:proline racemase